MTTNVIRKIKLLFSKSGIGYVKAYLLKKTKRNTAENIFTTIYRYSLWGDYASVSGVGSLVENTEHIREEIPKLLREKNIKTILDIPCGDFFWMKEMNLDVNQYIGADIVQELVEKNRKYENDKVSFVQLDLITDALPKVDLILCRDCLFHFSNDDIVKTIRNIKQSGASYLLATTFVGPDENTDIPTGSWRALNLELAPHDFPKPITYIKDYGADDTYPYKRLALWDIESLPTYSS